MQFVFVLCNRAWIFRESIGSFGARFDLTVSYIIVSTHCDCDNVSVIVMDFDLVWFGLDCAGLPTAAIEPVPESSVSSVEQRSLEDRERWWKMGLKAIHDGKLGVLLLSGGQVRDIFLIKLLTFWIWCLMWLYSLLLHNVILYHCTKRELLD